MDKGVGLLEAVGKADDGEAGLWRGEEVGSEHTDELNRDFGAGEGFHSRSADVAGGGFDGDGDAGRIAGEGGKRAVRGNGQVRGLAEGVGTDERDEVDGGEALASEEVELSFRVIKRFTRQHVRTGDLNPRSIAVGRALRGVGERFRPDPAVVREDVASRLGDLCASGPCVNQCAGGARGFGGLGLREREGHLGLMSS